MHMALEDEDRSQAGGREGGKRQKKEEHKKRKLQTENTVQTAPRASWRPVIKLNTFKFGEILTVSVCNEVSSAFLLNVQSHTLHCSH